VFLIAPDFNLSSNSSPPGLSRRQAIDGKGVAAAVAGARTAWVVAAEQSRRERPTALRPGLREGASGPGGVVEQGTPAARVPPSTHSHGVTIGPHPMV